MKKITFAFTLILAIAIAPCIIEGVRTGGYSFFPGLIASIFLTPAAIIYLLLSETKIKSWILRGSLIMSSLLPVSIGIRSLDAELHGPLVGYWTLPATIIFIPIILVLPSIPCYKTRNPQPVATGQRC